MTSIAPRKTAWPASHICQKRRARQVDLDHICRTNAVLILEAISMPWINHVVSGAVLALAAISIAAAPAQAQVNTLAPKAIPGARPVTVERIKVHSVAVEGNLE